MAFSIKQTKARSTDGRAKIAHTVKIVKSSSLPQVTQTQQHRVIINLTVYVLEALGPQLHSFDCSWRQQIFKRSFTFVLLSVPPPSPLPFLTTKWFTMLNAIGYLSCWCVRLYAKNTNRKKIMRAKYCLFFCWPALNLLLIEFEATFSFLCRRRRLLLPPPFSIKP